MLMPTVFYKFHVRVTSLTEAVSRSNFRSSCITFKSLPITSDHCVSRMRDTQNETSYYKVQNIQYIHWEGLE